MHFLRIIAFLACMFALSHSYLQLARSFLRPTTKTCQRGLAASARPSLDDVERISRGQAAKKRGVGSRAVPHRLNEAERKEWDLAKQRRYLMLRGTGWRKERGDSPLANIWRNYCDAANIPAINIVRSIGDSSGSGGRATNGTSSMEDHVVVDLSPLRSADLAAVAAQCMAEARAPQFAASLTALADDSSFAAQGWEAEAVEKALAEDAIWRIPTAAVRASFSDRAHAKKYAEAVAQRLAR